LALEFSDSAYLAGYGVQSALFAPKLNEDYDVAISAFYGLEGAPVKWKGIPLLPGLGGNFGAEFLPMHAMRWGGGDPRNCLTVTLMDVWVLPPIMVEQLGGHVVNWTPVDHDPAPPGVKKYFENSPGAIPMAMSRFGQEALAEFSALYCPHAVDASVYKPYPQKDVREVTGVHEDAFLVGMVSANKGRPSRKGFQFAFEAFKRLRDKHENAYLYLHTSTKAEWMQGEALQALASALDLDPNSVLWADQYRLHFDPHPADQMAQIYSSMDCLLNPTTGGGFEISQLEAAACGVPSVTTDFTAMPESAGPSPWKVGGMKYWTGQESWNVFADVDQLTNALEDCYRMSDKERRALSRRLRRHAEKYDVNRVYEEHMLPSIRKAEKRIRKQAIQFDVTEGLQVDMPERKPSEGGPSISIVTPWQDHPELAEDYFRAVGGEKVEEIIIVDNGSDPPLEAPELVSGAPHVKVLRSDDNLGFCPANNIGLEAATGDAILFLNNDIALGIPGWLETLRAELKPGVLVGANVRYDEHGTVDGQPQPYLDGWCIAGMREDFEKLGGWDEDYEEPAYYSDNDLCLRAKRAGMSFVAVDPPLIHLLNKTAGPPVGWVQEATRRNYRRFAEKVRESEAVAA
jgi:glycosyltransferase involved in cell wall biosynthesis